MNEGDNSRSTSRGRRIWTPQQELLFIDVWEANWKKLEESRKRKSNVKVADIYENMQQELALHSCMTTVSDIRRKISTLSKKYKQALNDPKTMQGWVLFDKIHSLLNLSAANNNADFPEYQNGSQNGETIWSINDSQDYIGCETDEMSLDCETRVDTFQICHGQQTGTTTNSQTPTTPLQLAYEPKNNVINLDCDDDDDNHNDDERTKSAQEQYLNDTTNFSLPQFQECQTENSNMYAYNAFQTIRENQLLRQSLNPNSNSNHTSFISKIQAIENSFQPISNGNILEPPEKRSKHKTKNKTTEPNINVTGKMLETLTSIDKNINNFIQMQEKFTKEIYRENIQQTLLLTKLLEQEVKKTQIMEQLVKSNNGLKQAICKHCNTN